jgi:hypothetical protein
MPFALPPVSAEPIEDFDPNIVSFAKKRGAIFYVTAEWVSSSNVYSLRVHLVADGDEENNAALKAILKTLENGHKYTGRWNWSFLTSDTDYALPTTSAFAKDQREKFPEATISVEGI